jgi:Bacteriophage HK97-gp10, putative tail-component
MSGKWTWDGLDEFKAQLRNLPADLADDAGPIVLEAAEVAQAEAERTYPERTGNLKNGLRIDKITVGRFGAAVRLVNRSPHAHLFENGTQTRQTAIGANRGAMPAGHVQIPAAIRARRDMYDNLKDLIAAHPLGLTVSGE